MISFCNMAKRYTSPSLQLFLIWIFPTTQLNSVNWAVTIAFNPLKSIFFFKYEQSKQLPKSLTIISLVWKVHCMFFWSCDHEKSNLSWNLSRIGHDVCQPSSSLSLKLCPNATNLKANTFTTTQNKQIQMHNSLSFINCQISVVC